MPALHVVVRPRFQTPTDTLKPLSALLDAVVDGVNLTARVGAAGSLDLLSDLAFGVASATSRLRGHVTVPLHAEDESWELGLQTDASDVLLTVFSPGPVPAVASFEKRIPFEALRLALITALRQALSAEPDRLPITTRRGLRSAERELLALAGFVARGLPARETVTARERSQRFEISATLALRPMSPHVEASAQLERAELHPLLCTGVLAIAFGQVLVEASGSQIFLDCERMLNLAESALESYQSARPTFRRANLSRARISLRRGPGDALIELQVAVPDALKRGALVCELPTATFVRTVARFGLRVVEQLREKDPEQARNLRLRSFSRLATRLLEQLKAETDDENRENPSPDTYRRFAPRLRRNPGLWESGPKMRFSTRWVASVPNIDLRSTFLCGDRLMVGAANETACLDRRSGEFIWKRTTRPAACVVTPSGLVRIEPDGRLQCHHLEDGAVRFTIRVTPRAIGGATGAVLYGAGLPKLLALTEGDRQVTGVDLVSGDIRWRYTARRPGAFRIRRAGRLLLIAGGDPLLVALDGTTGEVVWSLKARLPFTGDLVSDHECGFAVSGTAGGSWSLVRFNPWSGKLDWTVELSERPVLNRPPLLTPREVVVPIQDEKGVGAVAYDRVTGGKLWEHAPGLASSTTAWLAVDDCIIANSASGVLLGLNARTGAARFSHVFSSNAAGDQPRRLEPVLRSGALFVPHGEIAVVRPSDGELLGKLVTELVPDLIRVDERCDVYAAEESGHLAAFGAAPRLAVVGR